MLVIAIFIESSQFGHLGTAEFGLRRTDAIDTIRACEIGKISFGELVEREERHVLLTRALCLFPLGRHYDA